jgi:PAS domain S-box-containing protein
MCEDLKKEQQPVLSNNPEAFIEYSGVANIIVDENGTILKSNKIFEELSGYSKAEIENKKRLIDFIDSEDQQFIPALLHIGKDDKSVLNFKDKQGINKYVHLCTGCPPDSNVRIISLINITKQVESMRHRIALERATARIGSNFPNIKSRSMDSIINDALNILGEAVSADRIYLLLFSEPDIFKNKIFFWNSTNVEPLPREFYEEYETRFPWTMELLKKLKPINISDVESLPEKADSEKANFKDKNIKTQLLFPVYYNEYFLGVLGFDFIRSEREFIGEDIDILQIISDIFAGGLINKLENEEKDQLQKQLIKSQKMESIGNLASGIAHDFNNIITIIQGRAQIVSMDLDRDNPLKKEMEYIIKACKQSTNITSQLLLFSRNQIAELSTINLNELIKDLMKVLQPLTGENIAIITEFSDDLWNIFADRSNINQIIMNLAVNSKDAMPGGGKILLKTENIVISDLDSRNIPDSYPGKFVRLIFEDTGVGINEGNIQRIFEPFFTTKEKSRGTGLGLSVVYGIIKNRNGWISVSSEPGKGAMFKIYLPAYFGEDIDIKTETISISDLFGNGERILVVEDDISLLDFVSSLLLRYKYNVYRAENAEKAIEIFKKENGDFQLLLSDIVMPGKSGLELARELTEKNPNLKVILNSGYTKRRISRVSLEKKGIKFIFKPYTIEQLLKTVREQLDISH